MLAARARPRPNGGERPIDPSAANGAKPQEENMELGYFMMPSHPPERSLRAGHEWDLQVLRWLDELGYREAWVGEHHCSPWEPNSAPDLLLAQAFAQTRNIRLGPGGFLLPYHHPAELANRVATLDHISGGRLNFGVAASGLPSDWQMFNVDGMSGVNRDMTREALESSCGFGVPKNPSPTTASSGR